MFIVELNFVDQNFVTAANMYLCAHREISQFINFIYTFAVFKFVVIALVRLAVLSVSVYI